MAVNLLVTPGIADNILRDWLKRQVGIDVLQFPPNIGQPNQQAQQSFA